jgi:hypothetical protein
MYICMYVYVSIARNEEYTHIYVHEHKIWVHVSYMHIYACLHACEYIQRQNAYMYARVCMWMYMPVDAKYI